MKKQITKFSIHQTSKVFGILYFVFSALIAIPWGIYILATVGAGDALIMFLIPILYLIFGYIGFAIFSFIYNLVASAFGGIEFTIDECGCSTEVQKREADL